MADIKGYFKVIILKKLDEKEQTGYDLILSLGELFDRKPSAGSIYPLLNYLLKEGHITVRQDGRKKIYSITKGGKNALNRLLQEKEQIMIKTVELLTLFGSLSGRREQKLLTKLMDQMKSRFELLLRNVDVWVNMKDTMIKLVTRDDYEQKQKHVREILQETTKKLKKLQKED